MSFPASPFNWVDALSEPTRTRVLAQYRPLNRYRTGHAFQVGDLKTGLFRVIEGRADMYATLEDGKSVLFNCYFPGECFGEMPFLDGGEHIVSLQLQNASKLSVLPADVAEQLRNELPEFNKALTLAVCTTLRMLFAYHFAKLGQSPEKHLLMRIENFCDRLQIVDRAEVKLPISQDEFARILGISRRTVVDVLNRLEQRGIVRREYGALHVSVADLRAVNHRTKISDQGG